MTYANFKETYAAAAWLATRFAVDGSVVRCLYLRVSDSAVLVICGFGVLNPILFAVIAVIATMPLAAMSWFLVEKRAPN